MAKKQEQNLPVLSPPRLPYHPAVEDRFGIDKSGWKALVEAIFPNAQAAESVILALSYCKARNLDPFKRCIHIVPVWDKKKGRYVDTIWPGIGELRTTAHRTKSYAGRDKTEFGPMIEQTWDVTIWKDKKKVGTEQVSVKFPEWAQVTVYRTIDGHRSAFAGPMCYWLESYSSTKDGAPNAMWQKRPIGQIDKCAEAAALRVAFPEEVGNDYIDAEAHLQDSHPPVDFDDAVEAAENKIDETMGTKQIESADVTGETPEEEPPAETETQWRCSHYNRSARREEGQAAMPEVPEAHDGARR